MTTRFTAHGLEFELTGFRPWSARKWMWSHINDNGDIAHSSVELSGLLSLFNTPEEAIADAEAYALQVSREMVEAQSRPCPTADMIEALTRPYEYVIDPEEILFEVETDNGCNTFNFSVVPSDLQPGKWVWIESNENVQSDHFGSAFEAQKDAIRHASEWMPEHIREYEDRMDRQEYIRNGCYN